MRLLLLLVMVVQVLWRGQLHCAKAATPPLQQVRFCIC
jgi:hypothetical protein